ncbi:NAD-dependent epimerase/dehydratase family protein [Tomitella fengzijianii]|uniref:NAD(P)-dependent oxidoreductase n=1 Tax=Tomitella fengzijianii TaxID=2597660 RepID=A0A516WZS9_9ACTN|nr:NAD(P)-dependent oxidoreductase [Tomitella fengzijianii]QDQ96247.1 NAD(P)-dependent oxidoreductase [Tomitella fengzijianii]
MKVLVVGGTGMIGTHFATHLRDLGDEVTLAARSEPAEGTVAAQFPVIRGDYTRGDFSEADLEPFEGVVFAAGNDPRHLPKGADAAEFWESTQVESVPRFAALAKKAGVRRFVQVGSYYHQVLPELVESNPYVRGRALADERARELADADFAACTLNPPSILGVIPGAPLKRIARFVQWADGGLPDVPNFAPAGGTNYMSVRSLSEAAGGALHRGEPGKAYLIGDANWSFREYFQTFFDAAGSTVRLEERDEEHPMMPDPFIIQGRGNTISYRTDPEETALLGYRQGDAQRAVEEMVAKVRESS